MKDEFVLNQEVQVSIDVDLQIQHCMAVVHAAKSLLRDLENTLGCKVFLGDVLPATEKATKYIELKIAGDDNKQFYSSEQYRYIVTRDSTRLIIFGSDLQGLLWGIYNISSTYLGVNPFHQFMEMQGARKACITIIHQDEVSAPPLFRFRGWFFNDEDYITGWREAEGERAVDYLFYRNIMNHRTVDEICDAALRNRVNFLIPSSFLDIDNPKDEENIRRITEKGLFVSQHHIEPLGVSHYAYENYFRKQGRKERPSYFTKTELFEEVWRHYVRKWAAYKNVIWQIGLRGDVDRPVWKCDPSAPQGMESAGKMISSALDHQLRIIQEETGDNSPPATITLWSEGASLYKAGYLQIPENVMIIFANIPHKQQMNKDFEEVPRKPEGKYGVYHHTGYYYIGPHVAQGHRPEKIRNLLQEVVQKGDRDYALTNVQNLRELVLGVWAFSKYAYDGTQHSEAEYLKQWCCEMAPSVSSHLETLYQDFYKAYTAREYNGLNSPLGDVWLDGQLREVGIRCVDKYPKGLWERYIPNGQRILPCETEMSDSERKIYEKHMEHIYQIYPITLQRSLESWKKVRMEAEALCRQVEGQGQLFIQDNLLVQAVIMEGLSGFAYNVLAGVQEDRRGNSGKAQEFVMQAVEHLRRVLQRRTLAEHGKFANWYRLDNKFNLPYMIENTLKLHKWLGTPIEKRVYEKEELGGQFDYINNYQFHFGV